MTSETSSPPAEVKDSSKMKRDTSVDEEPEAVSFLSPFPNEVKEKIYGKLRGEDISKLRFINKQVQSEVDELYPFTIKVDDKAQSPEELTKLLSRRIRTLNVKKCERFQITPELIQYPTYIKNLNTFFNLQVSHPNFSSILEQVAPNVENATFVVRRYFDQNLHQEFIPFRGNFKKLKTLRVIKSGHNSGHQERPNSELQISMFSDILTNLSVGCSKLIEIDLRLASFGFFHLAPNKPYTVSTLVSLYRLISNNSDTLKILRMDWNGAGFPDSKEILSGDDLNLEMKRQLKKVANLKQINLSVGSFPMFDLFAHLLRYQKNLEIVNLNIEGHLDKDFAGIRNLFYENRNSLKEISLSFCCQRQKSCLDFSIFQPCLKLKVLKYSALRARCSQCYDFFDFGLMSWNEPEIKNIYLLPFGIEGIFLNRVNIDETELAKFEAEHFPNIKQLDLDECTIKVCVRV